MTSLNIIIFRLNYNQLFRKNTIAIASASQAIQDSFIDFVNSYKKKTGIIRRLLPLKLTLSIQIYICLGKNLSNWIIYFEPIIVPFSN